jgi:hypothetical protein
MALERHRCVCTPRERGHARRQPSDPSGIPDKLGLSCRKEISGRGVGEETFSHQTHPVPCVASPGRGQPAIRVFSQNLLRRIADFNRLRCDWQAIQKFGGQAAGPDDRWASPDN